MEDALKEEDKVNRLMGLLQAFLLINPQSESALLNLQKLIDEWDAETQGRIYQMVKQDLTARTKRQIALLHEQIERF